MEKRRKQRGWCDVNQAGLVESLGDGHRAFKVEPVSEGDTSSCCANTLLSLAARTRETLARAHAILPLHTSSTRERVENT